MKKPRVKDKDIRIQEIQAAAKKVFLRKGFTNTTVEGIAKKAGISKGTVYLYFKNKQEVYIALMIPVIKEIGRELGKLEGRVLKNQYSNCRKLVEGILMAHWRAYENDPEGMRIVQAFLQGDHFSAMSKETLQEINDSARTNFETFRRILSHSVKSGLMKRVELTPLADFLWGSFLGIIEVEGSKLRVTKKDHVFKTLKYAFSIISDGICPG